MLGRDWYCVCEQAALAQRDQELEALRQQLAKWASASDALKAATDRAEQLAQQLQTLEGLLQEQSSRTADAIKVKYHTSDR